MALDSIVRTGLQQKIGRLLLTLLSITIAGTFGYILLEGWGPVESLYMTVITLSTVGFREVHQLSTAGQLFTTVLIIAGVGTVAYSFGSIGRFLISGELRGTLRRRSMQSKIDRLRGHVIVCGFGRVGQQVTSDLERQGLDVVVVDPDPESFQGEPDERLAVVADASDDEELGRCHIKQARGLIAATGNDATNTFITLTARSISANLVIVARCNHPSTGRKLLKAGANNVISPYAIAGHRMAAQLLHPSVVDFLDVVMHSGQEEIWLEEVEVHPGADLDGKTLVESNLNRRLGINVLAVRRKGRQDLESGPISDSRLEPGDVLVALGTRKQLDALRTLG